ncbi:hypothetical protein [Aquipseudomonas ullengensis]|uniref:Uncharacterized protein n=1 Tax=Aquipseudomonas ullengensis TaxID=2759166 RepID=A0A7W4LLY7_9GAMM|nr:hypothetical protein [Pseudomonas ullengensis]MBB2495611.1 hypothetical protein [Pseudomonas ullengensis]
MDANNPFQTPAADLVNPGVVAAGEKLYSLAAVGWATFFGTPLAGAYVLAHNFRSLGLHQHVKTVWLLAIGLLLAVSVLTYVLPENLSGTGFTVAQVMGMYFYAKSLIAAQITEHRLRDGAFYSNWRAVGIGLLMLVAVLVVVVPLMLLTGLA